MCFEQQRLVPKNKEETVIPLSYWIYDGENVPLPYITELPSRIDPTTHRKCMQLAAAEFGSLNNSEGRFQVVVLFGKEVARR